MQKLGDKAVNANSYRGAGHRGAGYAVYGSPTAYLLDNALLPPPPDFYTTLRQHNITDAAGAKSLLKNNPGSLLAENIGYATTFLFSNLDPHQLSSTTMCFAQSVAQNSELRQIFASPDLAGSLNYEMVRFFKENRKIIPAANLAESVFGRIQDALGGIFGAKHSKTEGSGNKPREFQTIAEAASSHSHDSQDATKLGKLTARFMGRLFGRIQKNPDILSQPGTTGNAGENLVELLEHFLLQTLPKLYDDNFLATLKPASRKLFINNRDKIAELLLASLPAEVAALITKPDAFTIKVSGYANQIAEVEEKHFEDTGYPEATAPEAKAGKASGRAHPKGVVNFAGRNYLLDHAHYHNAPEHFFGAINARSDNFAGELHIVHKTADGKNAFVIAVQLRESAGAEANPVIAKITGAEHSGDSGDSVDSGSSADFGDLVPKLLDGETPFLVDPRGTLTTKGYAEGVTFAHALKPLELPPQQIAALKNMVIGKGGNPVTNASKIQPNFGRTTFITSAMQDAIAATTPSEVAPNRA